MSFSFSVIDLLLCLQGGLETVKDVVKTHPQDNEPIWGLQAPTCYPHTDPSMLPRKYSGKGDSM